MSDWTFKDLESWDDKIIDIASKYDLDWFPINYEVCDYYEMIGHMSYHGMPSHYQHWSYGKSFERTHQMYNMGMEGLPYELIINSDPSIAYLMRQNPLYLQILIMAHCIGHSDFFKNNRLFNMTRPESVVSKFRNSRKRIQSYTENPNIGLRKVENFLDAVHCIRFQTERNNLKRKTRQQIKSKFVKIINDSKQKNDLKIKMNLDKPVLEPDRDLLSFLIENGTHYDDWQLDILNIIRDEAKYFIPQMKTKILNEGWASFWHYKIMKELDLPQEYHIPFLKSHNQVIRPHIGRINPYHLGFHIFEKIQKEKGLDECFFIRETHDDIGAIRCYLDIDDFRKLNLFSYSNKKDSITIDDISDESGWKKVRDSLCANVGISSIPLISVIDITRSGDLILEHVHDGRDLDLEYAEEVVNRVKTLWPKDVKFFTIIEEEPFEI